MRRILLVIGLVPVLALGWYLFIKPYDYLVTFTARANAGTINQSLKTWLLTQENAEILDREGIYHLEHLISFNDSVHRYYWQLIPENDSVTKVKVYAGDPEHSLQNKLRVPFRDTGFEKRTRNTILEFNDRLKEHKESIRVRVIGEAELPTTYCAYVTARTSQLGKARSMMRDNPLLSNLLAEYEVPLNGPPFLEVTEWDQETDSLTFNFCYPIVRSPSLPQHPELKYKRFYGKRALKAEYNGNYITSDRAWYTLLDYAKSNGIQVTGLPVEIFYNNPNMGGDALQWKAEVFMPLKSSEAFE